MLDKKTLISQLDLSNIVQRMIEIYHWPEDVAFRVCCLYRRFLYLKLQYGILYTIPPSIEIDEFWHNHILHTKKYHDDCIEIFGEYLHHHPHHGMKGEISQTELERMFEEETQRLYFAEFGEYIGVEYKKLYKTQPLRKIYEIIKKFVRK